MVPNIKGKVLYENEDRELVPSFEKKGYRTTPVLFVNGKQVPEKEASRARPNQTLLSFLRDVMLLTGSKLGCAEGGCGACTVMVSKKDILTDEIKHITVNACLMPVLAADGCHITTIEGIGTVRGDNLHPIQKAMVEMHGSQCGYCTPGIIVAIYGLFANNATVEHLEEHLDGNLCRCTGYRPIWDAARSLCADAEDVIRGPCGMACSECPERDECEMECNVADKEKSTVCCSTSVDKLKLKDTVVTGDRMDWLQQPNHMFPNELKDSGSNLSAFLSKPLMVISTEEYNSGGTWFKPTTLIDMLKLLAEFGTDGKGGCKIVVGNTEVGVETKFKHAVYPRLLAPSETIESLFSFTASPTKISIGSCTPLSTIQHRCKELSTDPVLSKTTKPVHDMLRWFASTQIRNVACLGGNLVTASPISDMNPMLASMGASLIIASAAQDAETVRRRTVPVADFFIKYRTVDLKPDEMIETIEVPVVQSFEYLEPFKQARRREDDISIVTSGMRIRLQPIDSKWIVEDVCIAFGGMAPKTILALKTMNFLKANDFSASSFKTAKTILSDELRLSPNVPGGQGAYRLTLAASFLYKFFLKVAQKLNGECASDPKLPGAPEIPEEEASGSSSFVDAKKPSIRGTQKYPKPMVASGLEDTMYPKLKSEQPEAAQVGKPAGHLSGPLHCTGEALYADDIPLPPKTLQASLVLAKQCGCTLESISAEKARGIPGVAGVYFAADVEAIGGSNLMGAIVHDEYLFLPIGSKVQTYGQVIGVAVAESLELADLAARTVEVAYGPLEGKVIVSIEDAIEAGSFFEFARHTIERGDMDAVKEISEESEELVPRPGDMFSVSGSFRTGGQDHFYLETNSTLVVPSDSDTDFTVFASTQATTKTQKFCSLVTNTPASKVVVKTKRMGGGFGGKETRSVFVSCAAALASKVTCRPVRITISRETDMSITGGRHSFLANYKASATMKKDGGVALHAVEVKLYSNGGWAFDLTGPVMDRALFHVDGCYYWPHFRAEGVPCKTAQPNHTAFRGFGGPQGIAVMEHIMEHLAVRSGVDSVQLRRANMYGVGQAAPFGMIIGESDSGKWNVPGLWDRMHEELCFDDRRRDVDGFNDKNKWLKRGLAIVPTKFGIAFTSKFMNQGGALVHVYTDGTVLVTHGGTEMGQGLHTKVCQVAAQALGCPLEDVYVNETSTDKVANTQPTAASMSTDMYGMATLDACRKILKGLEPIREQLGPGATLKELANAAFFARIDLTAHGFFCLDSGRCGFEWGKEKPNDFPQDKPENSWKGHPFNYFTQGVAITEVEVDVLTGNHRTIRSDVVVDVGSSINPVIDIGQIEGAFAQGMGWSTIEEVVYADSDHPWVRPAARTFTSGPGTYKIPAFNDVPEEFNISLLEDVDNPFAVHSSKAIGEPPFFLGASVFYAIKDAVRAARRGKQEGEREEYFEMRMPATSERIRMYCDDEFAVDAINETYSGSPVVPFQPSGSH